MPQSPWSRVLVMAAASAAAAAQHQHQLQVQGQGRGPSPTATRNAKREKEVEKAKSFGQILVGRKKPMLSFGKVRPETTAWASNFDTSDP